MRILQNLRCNSFSLKILVTCFLFPFLSCGCKPPDTSTKVSGGMVSGGEKRVCVSPELPRKEKSGEKNNLVKPFQSKSTILPALTNDSLLPAGSVFPTDRLEGEYRGEINIGGGAHYYRKTIAGDILEIRDDIRIKTINATEIEERKSTRPYNIKPEKRGSAVPELYERGLTNDSLMRIRYFIVEEQPFNLIRIVGNFSGYLCRIRSGKKEIILRREFSGGQVRYAYLPLSLWADSLLVVCKRGRVESISLFHTSYQ